MNEKHGESGDAGDQLPSIEQLASRVEAQGQWIMAAFVIAVIAIVLAALLMVQINRVQSGLASQSQLIAELQKHKAMDDFLRSSREAAGAADPQGSDSSESPGQ